jgi:uncharacterized membrane protein
LGEAPLWYDECFSVFHAQKSMDGIKQVSKWDINPPGYLIVLSPWIKIFGISEFSARLFSAIFMALAAVMLFVFSYRHYNLHTAAIGSLFFIFSDSIFFYSHEARGYAFIFFLTISSSYFLLNFLRDNKRLQLVFLGICYYLLIYTHYLTGFIILAHSIYVIIFHVKKTFWYSLSGLLTVLLLFPMRKRIFDLFEKKTGASANNTWLTES